MNKTVDLIYFNAGGGHRASAIALRDSILQQQRPWKVRLVNLTEVLDRDGSFRRRLGFDPEDFYNTRLAHGWTLGLGQELKLLQGLIRFFHNTLLRFLQQHWLHSEPDLVVSLVPNFNRVLYESVTSTLPGVPYVTVLTDMADHPPHFWIEPGQDQHIVCGTPRAAEQARAAGYSAQHISLTSGMLLRPSFYRAMTIDRAGLRRELGLDPDRPTGLVMFGGQGSMQMLALSRALRDVQLILLCGHNTALARRLRAQRASAPRAVLGFSSEVEKHMRTADFFVGKPGPGCLSEAVHCGLPVITVENAWTMPQERFNTQWVRDTGTGLVLRSWRSIAPAVAELLQRLPEFQARVASIDNRAAFELPEILAGLLEAAATPSALSLTGVLADRAAA